MADKKVIIAIKVKFELNTKDGLRRVVFGLEKDKQGTTIVWKINFQLFERDKKTDDFGAAIVNMDVEVDQELTTDAEQVAAANRFTSLQKAHALGEASDAAKAAKAGEIDPEVAHESIQETLSA